MDGGAAAAAAAEVLVQNLINICKAEISLIQGLKKDARKLKQTLVKIQSFLNDAEKKFITEEAVKTWLKELEAVAFDADNVLDELNYHVLSKKMKTMMKAEKKKVPSCFPSFNHYLRRRGMALTIKEINTTFESINTRATGLGLESRLANFAPAASNAGLETDSFSLDPIFIGREKDVSKIVGMLTRSPTEQVLSILPIVGMGGLGKTTLARKVFNHEKIKTHFGKHIWVHVSANFDPVSLLKKILTTLTSGNDAVGIREVILKRLQEALGAKTYLLVLDDVWNQDPQNWEGFVNSLSGISSVKGNGIIVTTRNTNFDSVVQTLPFHQLKVLSQRNCWSIIKAKTFGEGHVPPEFETIGKDIAKRCQGLPLAANVVGGVLHGKSKNEWFSIKQSWLSYVGGHESISKILKLSFDRLSSLSLKKCFAYCCSIFPKGAWIERTKLIELWMAEGFLQPDQVSDMETVGNNYFNLLLQNSLLQVLQRDEYDNVTLCSMHDLVHDVACSVLGLPIARYISECYGDDSSFIPKEKAKCLRTLFFKGGTSGIRFSDFKSLHVLTLMHHDVKELPSSIRELLHLRCLDISQTSIQYLPNSIGELYHLQTLRAEPRKLPGTLKYLINLRHLHVPHHTELPPKLGMLTSLQTLPYFKVRDEKGHQIVELGRLKNLKGELKIHNLEGVHGEEEAKKANLFQKPKIDRLVLRWEETREGEINDENVLAGLQPHSDLKILEVFGFRGTSFPLWTLKMEVHREGHWIGLDNLMEIRLIDCRECEEIPWLGRLPLLNSLHLSRLGNVKSVGSLPYGIHNCRSNNTGVCKETITVFPALKRLHLSDMPKLTVWVEVEFPSAAETRSHEVKVVFPCLEHLEIKNCKQFASAQSQFPCLKELNICEMDRGLPLANICGIELMSLTKLTINGIDGLVRLPGWLFRNNQNLSELRIISCRHLRELPDGLHSLSSLEELRIEGCPKLETIPYSSGGLSQGFTLLRGLTVRDCEGLIDLPCEMVELCWKSLERLFLEQLSSVTNLPMIMVCLQKMSRLRELRIVNVPKLIMTSSSSEIGSFRRLQELTVGPASGSWDCVSSFNEAVDGILRGSSQSLRVLELAGMEDWDSLPDSLQHLTALYRLNINNFGIRELPEWFRNLTSLRRLILSDCKELRRLPSVEAMRRLTKLSVLKIQECPLLKQRCIEQQSSNGDSEWPKISHLPYVLVDRRPIRWGGGTREIL